MATKKSVLEDLQEYAKKLKARLPTPDRIAEENTKARFVNPPFKDLGMASRVRRCAYGNPLSVNLRFDISFFGVYYRAK